MNELDPELNRLIKWSRKASPPGPAAAPFGFAGRVVASRKLCNIPTLLHELQQGAWALACASLTVIVCGGLILVSQPSTPAPATGISSALDFVANHLPQ